MQVAGELRVRSRPDEKRMPGGEHLVQEARLGDLRRANRTAQPVVPLEHEHAPAAARQQRSARERVDPAAHEDHVVALPAHSTASPSVWNVRLK